ncbi:MAG: bifunctional folylpolyglutamate synthase/dihydrofolate synthase [Chitinophagales bacterium]|nr:bifunctional folylpolyglutamate synthase/dihydrofolate synthase [Chitinophagales bacterium]
MTYKETIDFLYSQLPMYSRIGKAAYKTDLTNTLQLCDLLNHPEKQFISIHVAGTNGKGSTSHMLAAIFQSCGYKTGLYTSPHLKDFRERIRMDGEMIPETHVTEFVEKYKEDVLRIGCSFFEWTVGLAFDFFAKKKVDVAVIETGLGGRLDSTNVIMPALSVITNVSRDHTDMLGDTIEKIAYEKAGIIKQGVPVVVGESDVVTENIFKKQADEKITKVYFADKHFKLISSHLDLFVSEHKFQDLKGDEVQISSDLTGSYQVKNIVTVLQSISVLRECGFKLPQEKVATALSQVKKLTGLRGRWDVLQVSPLIIADVAHNESGLYNSLKQLDEYDVKQIHFVVGFVRDKELSSILPLFPQTAKYYFCAPDIPRGLVAEILHKQADGCGLYGKSYSSVRQAFDEAKKKAGIDDLIYVGGSNFVVAEIL